jgi:sugar phosphate isomerase/epimerase
MVQEIAGLGFQYVELSHGIRITLVPGILRALEEGLIRVSSTHNFCPLPTGVMQAAPNLFEPSRREFREHDQWLRHTKRTIDFAAQVGAAVVVLHLGRVEFFWRNPASRVRQFLHRHPEVDVRQAGAYRKVLDRALDRLRTKSAAPWQQVQASLNEIREHARAKRVSLGCENREKLDELPLDDAFEDLFQSLTAPHACGYWHDTGHADLKQRMGVLEHPLQLQRNAAQLLGFHLHDVDADGNDHRPIGQGSIDFEMVSEFWRPEHRLTLELSPRATLDDVLASKQAVETLIAKRFG